MNRREFLAMAAALGASLAWKTPRACASSISWKERRDVFPQGVASGDPHADSVIVWTRRPPMKESEAKNLTLEIAEDVEFHRVVATAGARVSAETDWTCRVLAAGLKPRRVYWYRFTDEQGFGSRVGRTVTAPSDTDSQPVRFVFVSCQNAQHGASNAYRRMAWEDERRPKQEQLGFVLHLGDFIYELVWYPEDLPKRYARRTREVVRYEHGEKIDDFYVPTTVGDYRAVYRGYLADPDLQDARARWPFVCMWDNHEFSWKGWQTQQNFDGRVRPAQTRKVAAMQAWFEYQPARVSKAKDADLDRYTAPAVTNAPIQKFDEHGLGLEPGNLAAVGSMKLFRTLRWGRNMELILTDNRTFRSEPVMDRAEAEGFQAEGFPFVSAQDVVEILDAGKTYNGGKPPDTIRFGGKDLPNPRKMAAPQSMIGAEQKAWFLERLRTSSAPWKVWGNSVAMMDWRLDFQNLPPGDGPRWPGAGYAQFADDDWSGYRVERAEILDFVRRNGITGFAAVAGDRHSFHAGLLSPALPPQRFEPVAVEFVTGSISAPGLFEAAEFGLPKDHPLRGVFVYQPTAAKPAQAAVNFSVMHGVKASLALQKTGDVQKALLERNAEVSPHLSFVDAGGHGYASVRATQDELEVEFVCIPRPLEPSESADGGPLAYRVAHRVKRWERGSTPNLERTVVEGELPLVV